MLYEQAAALLRANAKKGRQADENVAPPPSESAPANARRPAPAKERDLLMLLLQHPDELLGHWMEGYGNRGITHPGVRTILEMAWEITCERGRFDAASLLQRLRDAGRTNACSVVVRMLDQPTYHGDQYEAAFVQLAEELKASDERRQIDIEVRAQMQSLDTRGQLEAMRAFASVSSET